MILAKTLHDQLGFVNDTDEVVISAESLRDIIANLPPDFEITDELSDDSDVDLLSLAEIMEITG